MEEKERRKWTKLKAAKDEEIERLSQEAELNKLRLSDTSFQLLNARTQILVLQKTLSDTSEQHERSRMEAEVKINRARVRVTMAESDRDENRRAVEDLCNTVAMTPGLSRLPQPSIYLSEPVVPLSERPVLKWEKTFSEQDEAYLGAILSKLTAELVDLRQQRDELEKNYEFRIALLEANVSHRDALLQSYITPSSQQIPALPPLPPPPRAASLPPADRPLTSEDALHILSQADARHHQLEEENRQLARKLDEARQRSREKGKAKQEENDDTVDYELRAARGELDKLQAEGQRLREQVATLGMEHRVDEPNDLHDHRHIPEPPGEPTYTGTSETEHQKLYNDNNTVAEPAILRVIDKQIDELHNELEDLHTERRHMDVLDNDDSEPVPRDFDHILLLESECIRAQKAEATLSQELAEVTERLRRCEARHKQAPVQHEPTDVPLPSPTGSV